MQQITASQSQAVTGMATRPESRRHFGSHATRSTRTTCPGLNRTDELLVPNGVTLDDNNVSRETYCQQCANQLGIVGTVYQIMGGVCNGHLKLNSADNGVFNISMWEPSHNKFFTVEGISSDPGTYYVYTPPGATFNILVTSKNPNHQSFRYELVSSKIGRAHV